MADTIVRAAIYPSIGVARVGNSEQDFPGPEVPDWTSTPKGGYKDEQGALKRQAAKFRIYGFDAEGRVVRELTEPADKITWRVQIANTKAAWYGFEGPMDIPSASPVPRRNPGIVGDRRSRLRIEPKAEEIHGPDRVGNEFWGMFLGSAVYLGELQTDCAGRLIFLGGRGKAASLDPNNYIAHYSNNRWWYDDISDGPVTAEVTINGAAIPVEGAWIVTAPPNYSPHTPPIRSLYDVMLEAFQAVWPQPVRAVSFRRDVLPILRRFCLSQWVNKGFFLEFGWASRYNHNFVRKDYLEVLASKSPAARVERTRVLNLMRAPSDTNLSKHLWPQIYGDLITGPFPVSMLPLTQLQYAVLQQWAAGEFIEDANLKSEVDDEALRGPESIDDVDLQLRPDLLTETALRNCSGGPFDTGCEMTWVMRHQMMYSKPFRIRHRVQGTEPDYSDVLTPQIALAENGPLYESGPGDITRWMSVPWQCDVGGCGSGYAPEYDPYLPTIWPATVPNQVLTEQQLELILDERIPREQRLRLFGERADWMRSLPGGILSQMQELVATYGDLGVVVRREVEQIDPEIPKYVFVETGIRTREGE